ncbi:unnamed protein product [Adineta ricciae]|uniref:Uncharacterized protein n=1 Tax=Adineta ricciae TaxID=249248 RepID=A0A813THV5_ADIRI|nr:unnamed protein product [Adineta ricciae]CAF0812875.1 unnamed protein product [Adineta ricciae]
MTTSPSSGLSPEAKEFVPLGQNSAISIPLYVDENTVASIYPSDQQPLMVQTIYPMMVTNSKITDNVRFPEIEFHIQPSQQQQFQIDSCTNVPQSPSINGTSPSTSTSQIVLLPTTNSATAVTPTGYYPGAQIIYSTTEPVSAFYPIDYCEQSLINFSLQQPTQMSKSHRMLSQQQRSYSFRQHGINHSPYRPSSRGNNNRGGGNNSSGISNSRNSYYDYSNRRNGGSSYSSNPGRGNSSNSKRISSSYHSNDHNNYYHSSPRSRGYLSRSSQQQHDEYRKDYSDYYNHDNEYNQSSHMNEDGTPFEFRSEDFPSLPMNNQQSDNKTSTQSTASTTATMKSASSWNEIVSAPRRRSTSPQSMPPSQDQRSDRSRSFNNKLSSNTERKPSNKSIHQSSKTTKSANCASKSTTSQDEQPRSLSLTNSDLPNNETNTKVNDIKDDGFIQTKYQQRRLKRKSKLREEPVSFPEQSDDIESAPYALDDENAFPTLGQPNPPSTTKCETSQLDLPDMFNRLNTSTQSNSSDSKIMPKREQTKSRKSNKTKRSINHKEIEENQNQSISSITVQNQSNEDPIRNDTDTNTTNVKEDDQQKSNALSSTSNNSSDTSDYDDAVDNLNEDE